MRSFTEDCPFFYYVVKTQYYLLLYHTFTCFATSIRNFYYFFRTNLHYFLFLQSLINYLTIILRCDIITKDFWLNIDFGVWLSLVERLVRDQEVGCSSHLTPTRRELRHANYVRSFYYVDIEMPFQTASFLRQFSKCGKCYFLIGDWFFW